jgi:hypothetical protein
VGESQRAQAYKSVKQKAENKKATKRLVSGLGQARCGRVCRIKKGELSKREDQIAMDPVSKPYGEPPNAGNEQRIHY